MSDREVFTRKETSKLIQEGKKQNALEVWKQVVEDMDNGMFNRSDVNNWIKKYKKTIKELEGVEK